MIRTFLDLQVAEGAAAALAETFDRLGILALSAADPGCLQTELTFSADERLATVTALWTSPAAYDVWRSNPAREGFKEAIDAHLSAPLAPETAGRIHSVALRAGNEP